jgi:predicted anti-sigma-YlaC factor YlaD
MKKKTCPWEKDVIEGLGEEKLSEELQKHVKKCPVCRDIALVQGWMHRFKENAWNAEMPGKTLPDAQSLWDRVHAKRRPDKKLVRKALRPVMIYQVLFYGLVIAGIIYAGSWGFRKFGSILDNPVISTMIPFFGIMMVIVLISLSFCAIVAAFDKRKHST